MSCQKCNAPTEGEQTLCSQCAAEETCVSQEEIVQTEQAPAPMEASADTFILGGADGKPPKKKTGLVIGIVALAIVAALGLTAIFAWNTLAGFFGRTFQEPEDYLADVEKAAISEYSADLAQLYGKVLKAYASSDTAGEANIQLTLGNQLLTLAETALAQQNVTMELDWLSNIALSVNSNIQDSALQMNVGLGLGKTDLLSADMICNLEDGKLYLAIPELNPEYIYTDISYDVDTDALADALTAFSSISNNLENELPTEKEVQELIDTYAAIVLSGINNVEKSTETVTIDDVSQKMVVLTAKIKEKDLLNIMEKVLKKAENDKTLKKALNALSNYTNAVNEMNGGYYTEVDLYEEFIDAIPYLLEDLKDAKESTESNNYLKLHVYVDMQNNVRGHELDVYTDGKKSEETISWLTVAKGDTVYTEATLGEVLIEGEKTEKNDVSEGFYTLTVEDVKLGTLKFSDVSETSGTLKLVPSEEVMSELLSEINLPSSLLGNNIALELKYAENSYAMNILVGSEALIGFRLDSKTHSGGNISIPSNAIDASYAYSFAEWLSGADFQALLNALESANVPDELMEIAEYYVAMLQYYAS